MDIRQSKEYAGFLKEIGWTVEKLQKDQVFIKKIPLIGSAIKIQRTQKIDFKKLQEICEQNRIFQIIVEPEVNFGDLKSLYKNGFKLSGTPYLPTKTLQVDLTKSKKEIIAQMKKDGRYSLRKSEKIVVKEEKNIEKFREQWFSVVGHKRHVLPLKHMNAFKKTFGKKMILISWRKESGGMFLIAGDTAYYWIGFTSDKARDSLAQYQVIWKGMMWAKENGAKVFDFEGIYDDRFPIKGWQGFTHFKKSFGGKEIIYPGSFIKWRNPFGK